MTAELKNVVLVGFGPSGAEFAGAIEGKLPASHRLVVISKQTTGFHNLAALRASVVLGWDKVVPIPLDKVLQKKTSILLEGTTATRLSANSVQIDKARPDKGFESQEIPFDYLVLAPGSTYAFPCRPPTDARNPADVENAFRALQAEIRDSKSILVIGGGAIGVEFAGEVAAAYPKKTVTLVHAQDRLHNALFKPSMHKTLLSQLEALGVKVVLNHRLEYEGKDSGRITPRTFNLGEHGNVDADFVFIARGNTYNGQIAKHLSEELVTNQGQIKIKKTLQVDSEDPVLSKVYVIGDATTMLFPEIETKTWYNGGAQAKLAAANIVAQISGKPLKDFAAPALGGAVTVGPNGGAAQGMGMVLGSFMTKMAKSKKLMTPMLFKVYRVEPPQTYNNSIPVSA